jgi:hypothetical protein
MCMHCRAIIAVRSGNVVTGHIYFMFSLVIYHRQKPGWISIIISGCKFTPILIKHTRYQIIVYRGVTST